MSKTLDDVNIEMLNKFLEPWGLSLKDTVSAEHLPKLTEGDVNMIIYFQEERGDITRWSDWERLKPSIEKECPFFMEAWRNLNKAEMNMEQALRIVSEMDVEEDES